MGQILGNDLITPDEEPEEAPSAPIVDPSDPKFFDQMQPQIDRMTELLEEIRKARQ